MWAGASIIKQTGTTSAKEQVKKTNENSKLVKATVQI